MYMTKVHPVVLGMLRVLWTGQAAGISPAEMKEISALEYARRVSEAAARRQQAGVA